MQYPSLIDAVNDAVRAAKDEIKTQDIALIASCQAMALTMDEVLQDEESSSDDRLKVLWMMPNMINALRDLGFTPAGRAVIAERLAKLEALKPKAPERKKGSAALKSATRGGLKAVQ